MEKRKRGLKTRDEQARLEAILKKMIIGTHINVAQEVVITTEDKLLLVFQENLPQFGRRRDWLAPLLCLPPLIGSLFSSPFRDPEWNSVWVTLFAVCSAGFLSWFLQAVWRGRRSLGEKKLINKMLAEIKHGNMMTEVDPVWLPEALDDQPEFGGKPQPKDSHDVM